MWSGGVWTVAPSGLALEPSGDQTGVADLAAFTAALALLPPFGDGFAFGTITLAAGKYYFAGPTPNVGPHVLVKGAGIYSTYLYPVFTNTATTRGGASCFSLHGPSQTTGDFSSSTFGGGFVDLTIDGSLVNNNANSTVPVVGLDFGDVQEPVFNIRVQNFATLSGGIPTGGPMIAVWLCNYQSWSEKTHGFLSLENNDNALTFDISRSAGAGQYGASGNHGNRSHEFTNLDIYLYQAAEQNGILVNQGCSLGSSQLRVSGNYEKCNSTTTYSYAQAGTVPAGYPNSGSGTTCAMIEFHHGLTEGDPYSRPNTPSWMTLDANSILTAGDFSVRHSNIGNTSINAAAVFLVNGASQTAAAAASKFTSYADALQTSTAGNVAGTATSSQPFSGATFKRFIVFLSGFNTTGQNINFPTAFTQTPVIVHDDSGVATVTTAHVAFATTGGTTKTGWVIVEGY